MAYKGTKGKLIDSSYLFTTIQALYTKIKGLIDGKADKSHTHVPSEVGLPNYTNSYINTHPENNGVIIPFIYNDIAYLLQRGGRAKIFYDDVEQSVDINALFDGSPMYFGLNPKDISEIIIELTLQQVFAWTNTIYVDFGSAGWSCKSIKIEVINTNFKDDVWKAKLNTTTNTKGNASVVINHTPIGASNAGSGFNKIRFTFSAWRNTSSFRIAQLGLFNYNSIGIRQTAMSRGVDDPIFRSITPSKNNTYSLGSSTNKWANVYTNTINGTTLPSSPKFTDTNTWRGIQDNLTSTSKTDSLSANQGKVLKGLVDSKANANHTHNGYQENVGLHAKIDLKSGTFLSCIKEQIDKGYRGGKIEINDYCPEDTCNGNYWGFVEWTCNENKFIHMTFYTDRSEVLCVREYSIGEESNTGWKRINDGGNADKLDGWHCDNYIFNYLGYGDGYFNSMDVNDWKRSGVYAIQSGCKNTPASSGDEWGTILVLEGISGERITQIATFWNDGNRNLYHRHYNNGWSSWKTMNDSGNADKLDGYHADSFAKTSGTHFKGQVKIQSSEMNGKYNGLLVGDDCYIGDCNAANAIGLMGVSDNNKAYINFGKTGASLGYNGDGTFEFTNNISVGNAQFCTDGNIYIPDSAWSYQKNCWLYDILNNLNSKDNKLPITGFGESGLTFGQTDAMFDGNSGWCNYIIANHGDGESYFHYTIGLPFWGSPIYQRQTGNTSSKSGWHKFHTTETITKGTWGLTPGVSALANDCIYIQYE